MTPGLSWSIKVPIPSASAGDHDPGPGYWWLTGSLRPWVVPAYERRPNRLRAAWLRWRLR
jgi:hypothetical protein